MTTKSPRDIAPAPHEAARDLTTVRDFIRYAVSRFHAADIDYGHGTDNALDEAAFMVLEALSLPITTLEPWLDCQLTQTERKRIAQLIHDRVSTRKPASYLLNRAYIQGHPFYVDERVIVPRSFIGEIMLGDANPAEAVKDVESILDLCTGSGCLAILAAQLYPQAVVDAVDLSADALAVAAINVRDYGLDERVTLHHGDLFAPLADIKYDLIITNPPYVDNIGMDILGDEYHHEPRMALHGGNDGMDLVRKIIAQAATHLNPGGGMICELGRGKEVIEAAFPNLPFEWLDTENSEGEVFWISEAALRKSA
ncbi:MAG: 50S ribosomal protein L3 N(5)-glutamine methyltransferase [Alphaproteobacteria bacterium]|nr:50S ribosomal protein L3 N(5)-glutamine methyltransferase [Alphaproteobacteria bacterium]